jgi:hypothetical protein
VFPAGYDDPAEVARLLGARRFAIAPLITHRYQAAEALRAFEPVARAPWEIVAGTIDWRDG